MLDLPGNGQISDGAGDPGGKWIVGVWNYGMSVDFGFFGGWCGLLDLPGNSQISDRGGDLGEDGSLLFRVSEMV